MCGFTGIISFLGGRSISSNVVSMTEKIINRGPDDEGYLCLKDNFFSFRGDGSVVKSLPHISASFMDEFKIVLGFRRLKIVDLSNLGHQPMVDNERRFAIVFNGELYNYLELRAELIGLGHVFRTNSDTEVVLIAYKEWSNKALLRFNGMFAFSIIDRTTSTVFMARDRMGIKPFYYAKTNDNFIFGSTQKSILASGMVLAKISEQGVWENFKFSVAQRPHTCFESLKSLSPASYGVLNFRTGDFVEKKYWNIPVGTQDFSLTESQSKIMIEESLFKSIKYRLQADVEVGTFMSGGVDSTLISAIASKFQPDIKSLTLGFKNYEALNEIKEAQDTARLNNIDHIIETINPDDFIKKIQETVVAYEEPYHHLSANFAISSLAKNNNLKVVLNGLGGDELFGGYDVYKKLSFWEKNKKHKNVLKFFPSFHPKIKKVKQILSYEKIGQFYSHYYTTFSDSELGLLTGKIKNTDNLLEELYMDDGIGFSDNFEAISYFNLKSYIGNHQLRAVDSSTMSFSIEGRLPMLDHQFIETAFKIPSVYKNKNGISKYILKEVAKKYIAPSCLAMSKKGLGLPLEKWINNELSEFVGDHLSDLRNRNIFNNSYMDHIVKSKNTRQIWQLVSYELWLRNFIDNVKN
ncbi:asparagine synthase (glutamine-hydrolysing) [Wenyingzhuangia heitensis]|uniref:asparagine synthase (glutamine-hydrolyzing) n=1 Tax=Wenyingzhuangia heitensis TaxID=1487859 RepID=A0ABX0U453_9FLAO|nr:asparagine synthase (glutamine-hydrolyzing) [Wenyingzhuangia heitensis]NIJ43650.1 asparagine synthase (glutamine-hydrolysing) [Wenyingzhuangia heitensis]